METNKIIQGDCIEEMKKLPDNSVDAIITDPPYGLEFMGKNWDKFKEGKNIAGGNTGKDTPYARSKPTPAFYQLQNEDMLNFQKFNLNWAKECLRVLKPGGYLLSFGGSRTYHRMASGIEDAGFEIRDCIMWLYASGFPKSLNVMKQIEKVYKCGNTTIEHNDKQDSKHNLRPLQETNLQKTINIENKQREVLFKKLQEQGLQGTMYGEESKEGNEDGKESCMEGRSNIFQNKGKLQRCEICKMPKEISCYVQKGWLYYGTQINNGTTPKENIGQNRSDTSHRPQSREQQDRESYAICEQCRTQIIREHEGIGTALKPAHEPIVVARKPLSEKNVALNVLKWGTGGINIDACRIGIEGGSINDKKPNYKNQVYGKGMGGCRTISNNTGRFPANIILDEEAGKILDEQTVGKVGNGHWAKTKVTGFGEFGNGKSEYFGVGEKDKSKGGASRFFYCAKASKKERNMGCEDMEEKEGCFNTMVTQTEEAIKNRGRNPENQNKLMKNNHPTVKSLKLMEYLIKLVSREGAVVLDPFLGSGTTAVACVKLNRKFIGIEKEEDYIKIAKARIKPFMEQKKL